MAPPGRGEECSNRLYPHKNREPLYQYIKPGCGLTEAEHNLNRGALRGQWQFVDKVLPGGGETKYITHPEVAIQNWWERCVVEKPGWITSLGRKLPDNLTKCSEYREEISEYARFFAEHPSEEIRTPASHVSQKCIPMAVKMDHLSQYSPLSYYQTVYTRDFHKPYPAIPPQQFEWADGKRKKWIAETLDDSVAYCTVYQKNYHPEIYKKQVAEAKKSSLCPYIKIDEQNEHMKVLLRRQEDAPLRMARDRCLNEVKKQQLSPCAIASGQGAAACLVEATADLWKKA